MLLGPWEAWLELVQLFCSVVPVPGFRLLPSACLKEAKAHPVQKAAFKGPYWLGSCRDGLSCPAALCCVGSTLKQANGSWDPSQKPALTQTPQAAWGWHQALLPHYLWPGKGLKVSRRSKRTEAKLYEPGGLPGT